MDKANVAGALPTSRIGEKKLLILMSILVVIFMIDSSWIYC